MRCITLAGRLRKRGQEVCFFCRHLSQPLEKIIREQGYSVIRLRQRPTGTGLKGTAHADWLGVSQECDADDFLDAIARWPAQWVVVDHYGIDQKWEEKVGYANRYILVIDDLADRRHRCDVLLDQNFYLNMTSRYEDKVPGGCRLLLGPAYALLREEFQSRRGKVFPKTSDARRAFIFFGGVDKDNITSLALEAFAVLTKSQSLYADVVIGAAHPFRNEVVYACARLGFDLHIQTDRMAELMERADFAIGGGGSSVWERCVFGLPTLVVIMAANQRQLAHDLDVRGVVQNLGPASCLSKTNLVDATIALVRDQPRRLAMSRNSLALMTGNSEDDVSDIMVNWNAET